MRSNACDRKRVRFIVLIPLLSLPSFPVSTASVEMSRGEVRAHLARVLDAHVHSIQETRQMLENPASSSLDKVDWSEVTKLGDEVSKQATMAGMLWSGEAPDIKALEENLGAYFNVLHGFVLLCHGSTVGSGPTLHASIMNSAKQVVDCSLALLREAVSYYESRDCEKRLSIPQLAGTVWEACTALKKTPTTNCTAAKQVITQVAVSVKDVLREMEELEEPKCAASDDLGHGMSNKAAESTSLSDVEGYLTEDDIVDDLSAEDMAIVQLIISVISNALTIMKKLIRFITGLAKSSSLKINTKESIDSLEKLVSCCQEMGSQVNELGASVYPPQDMSQIETSAKKMYCLVDEMHTEVTTLEGSPDGVFDAIKQLDSSLGNLQRGLDGDLVNEMGRLAV